MELSIQFNCRQEWGRLSALIRKNAQMEGCSLCNSRSFANELKVLHSRVWLCWWSGMWQTICSGVTLTSRVVLEEKETAPIDSNSELEPRQTWSTCLYRLLIGSHTVLPPSIIKVNFFFHKVIWHKSKWNRRAGWGCWNRPSLFISVMFFRIICK